MSARDVDLDGPPFAVVCIRDDGRERVYQRYATQDQAERIAAALRRVGCAARAVTSDELPLPEASA